MKNKSLLGSLVSSLSSSPENIATEALCFILRNSNHAKNFFLHYLNKFSIEVTGDIHFQTQLHDDGKIPDLVGLNNEGNKVIIVENKFWAGLTENQPISYLSMLPKEEPAILLFLAPSLRIISLFNELIRRVEADKYESQKMILSEVESKVIKLNKYHFLAITSWRSILTFILNGVEQEHDKASASDIHQLLGLTERMDEEAFIPFESFDLGIKQGISLKQFSQVINESISIMEKRNIIHLGGLKQAHGAGWYGRYFFLKNYAALLFYSAEYWSSLSETPFWLKIQNKDFNVTEKVFAKFTSLITSFPPKAYRLDDGVYIPLFLGTNVDKDTVIESLIDQIVDLTKYMN